MEESVIYAPDLLIFANGTRCGLASGVVYSVAGVVSTEVPVEIVYRNRDDCYYASEIRKEISERRKKRMVVNAKTKELEEKMIPVPRYARAFVTCDPKKFEDFKQFAIDLPDGIERPRCPNCFKQGPVVMPDDGYPKVKPYWFVMTIESKKQRIDEPYCSYCRGRLALMLPVPPSKNDFIAPLKTDAQLKMMNVDIVGLRNDEKKIA